MTNINSWSDAVVSAVGKSLAGFASIIPNLVGAIIVFTIGWIVAGICKNVTLRILKVLQLEPFAEKVGLSDTLKRLGTAVTPPELIGELVKWFVVIVFLTPAVEILGLTQITGILSSFLLYIPNVLVAVIIVMFGTIFADLIAQVVKGGATALGASTAGALSTITKYSIVTFAVLAALSQLGIAQRLIQTLFTGFVAMLAIAGGLAFGLGGKDLAAEILENLKQSLRERK